MVHTPFLGWANITFKWNGGYVLEKISIGQVLNKKTQSPWMQPLCRFKGLKEVIKSCDSIKWQFQIRYLKCGNMQQAGCQTVGAVLWQSSHRFENSFFSEWHWCILSEKRWSMTWRERDGGGSRESGPWSVYHCIFNVFSHDSFSL